SRRARRDLRDRRRHGQSVGPQARLVNWASTLWHETNHVYVLTATKHRVPRWFAEGLAVHEESLGNPAWAYAFTPDVVVALRDKKLLPVAQLDRGFIHPEYPE